MTFKLRQAHYLLSETDPRRLRFAKAEVAFVGRSNVGKSSIINALCEQRGLAIVSKTPGRTRAINVFAVDPLRWLVDLPGYGFASGPTSSKEGWPTMIEGYLLNRPSLRAVYLLIDSKVGPTKLDYSMRDWLKTHHLPGFIVGNKIDQVKSSQRHRQEKSIAEGLGILPSGMRWISTTEGEGISALRAEITQTLE